MEKFFAEHWILSIILTILLGAIGSGLWDTAFKPIINKITNAIFTMFSFGAKRARDKIYKEAARGHHELPSLVILLFIFATLPCVILSLEFSLYAKIYKFEPELSIKMVINDCKEKEGSEKIECFKEVGDKFIRDKLGYKLHLLTLLSILVTVNMLFSFISINRTNLAITYYQQCLKICRPLIDDSTFFDLEQKYSLIETKEGYFEIISRLNVISEKNSINLPKLYIK